MSRSFPASIPALALLIACGGSSAEVATPVGTQAEVQMEATELMIPASQAEMLKEEIVALRAETSRLKTELEESKAPSTRKVVRHAMAMAELANAESELSRLKAELAQTREKLAKSEKRNEVLTEELEQSEAQLAKTSADLDQADKALRRTRLDLDGARRIAADAGWSDLVAQTQVALCPKGGRKKMEGCRADAVAAIAPVEPAARACLRSGQAAPQLQRAGRGDDMPRQAVWIGEAGDDFYVVLCDPSLPEARELLASRARRSARAAEPAEPVEKRTERIAEPRQRTAKASYERPVRERVIDDTPEPSDDFEVPLGTYDDEPLDLLSDEDRVDLAALGLMDLDGDDGDDDAKQSREERRKAKKEQEELEEAAGRRAVLDGAGDDLLDEEF